jgi:hypothetical protein
MTDDFRVSANDAEETRTDETAQPIIIRKLDRLETTSYNSQGAS